MIEKKKPPPRAGLITPKAKSQVTPLKKAPAIKDKSTVTVKVGIDGFDASMTESEKLAVMATQSSLAVLTLEQYAGAGGELKLADLMAEMKKKGDAVVGGDLTLIERMLVSQAITLDVMFHNLAQRAHRQESFKGIEVLMRLGLKAQAQARSTAEALALVKNPMPYIRQANIANGPQQVNNGNASASGHTSISTQSATHQNTAIADDRASGRTALTSQAGSRQKAEFSKQYAQARTPARGQFSE